MSEQFISFLMWNKLVMSFVRSLRLGVDTESFRVVGVFGVFKFKLENSPRGLLVFEEWLVVVHESQTSGWLFRFDSIMTSLRPHAATSLKQSVTFIGCFLSVYTVHACKNSRRCWRQSFLVLAWSWLVLSLRSWLSSASLNMHMRPFSSSITRRPYCSHTSSWRIWTVLSKRT